MSKYLWQRCYFVHENVNHQSRVYVRCEPATVGASYYLLLMSTWSVKPVKQVTRHCFISNKGTGLYIVKWTIIKMCLSVVSSSRLNWWISERQTSLMGITNWFSGSSGASFSTGRCVCVSLLVFLGNTHFILYKVLLFFAVNPLCALEKAVSVLTECFSITFDLNEYSLRQTKPW